MAEKKFRFLCGKEANNEELELALIFIAQGTPDRLVASSLGMTPTEYRNELLNNLDFRRKVDSVKIASYSKSRTLLNELAHHSEDENVRLRAVTKELELIHGVNGRQDFTISEGEKSEQTGGNFVFTLASPKSQKEDD